jgi:tRNA pseudouridine38-40 synthase
MTPAEIQLPRWRCTIAYDGTGFDGWQSQPGGHAVQDVLERRLAEIFGRKLRIHGSGRTDAGVHARGQVFHFDADWRHGAAKLLAALRGGLPPTIQVTAARQVPGDFHARFSASGKIYRYEIIHGSAAGPFDFSYCWAMPRALDITTMRAAAAVLRGRHDFRAFCADNGAEGGSTVRDLRRLDVTARGRRVSITAEADGFLYKMVRSLVGALVAAGQGRLMPEEIAALLRGGRRTHRVETAPPQGLFLLKVIYGGGKKPRKREAGRRQDEVDGRTSPAVIAAGALGTPRSTSRHRKREP